MKDFSLKFWMCMLFTLVIIPFVSANSTMWEISFEASSMCAKPDWTDAGATAMTPVRDTLVKNSGSSSCRNDLGGASNAIYYPKLDYDTLVNHTVTMWIRRSGNTDSWVGLSSGVAYQDRINIAYQSSYCPINTNFCYYSAGWVDTGVAMADETWYNLSLIRKGSNITAEANGVFLANFTRTMNMSYLYFYSNSADDFWLDDFKAYNETLVVTGSGGLLNASEDFDSEVIETETTTFYLNLTSNSTNVTNASFYWNNTVYPRLPSSTIGSTRAYSYSINLPSVSNSVNATNYSFYWDYNITYLNGTFESYNTSVRNQTVFAMIFEICGAKVSQNSYNFSIRDEDSDELKNADIETSVLTVWKNNKSLGKNYSFEVSDSNNFSMCIYPGWASYYTDVLFSYSATDYVTRTYYMLGEEVDNSTEKVNLYLVNSTDSSNIYIYVRDQYDSKLTNIYVEAYRYYPAKADYELVQFELTDADGLVLMKLIPYDVMYKFIVKEIDGTTILLETERSVIKSSNIYLRIRSGDDFTNLYNQIEGIWYPDYGINYSNATGTFSFRYIDQEDVSNSICLEVKKKNSLLCQNCSTSTISTLTCVINNSVNGEYSAVAYAMLNNGDRRVLASISKIISSVVAVIGKEGLFVVALMIGILGGVGVPVAVGGLTLIFMVFGLAAAVTMKLIVISQSLIVAIAILAIILIYRVSKRD